MQPNAFNDVMDERVRQDAKWGVQNHPDGTSETLAPLALEAKALTDALARSGHLTWKEILNEEVQEAFAEEDVDALRKELVQVAAVAIAWIQDIDRRK
jgi:hypothetical protein